MSLLHRIIYAAHAKGPHHKMALDALDRLGGPDAEGWHRLFLKHAQTYMTGAKMPDDIFKDFKNHCLHPRDNYWGGAPKAAREWYGKTVTALAAQSWPEAVNSAGVLSHYVTDIVHPFHTGQSEAENSIHRALEWSTSKSYETLKAMAADQPVPAIPMSEGADWLETMLRTAAARSNKHYEKLIAHYDIHRGVVDPPAGLDSIAQRIVGELIGYATGLYATILQRALSEAKVAPPEVSLTVDTVLATLQIPAKVLAKRLADKADRALVERMYDELKATGTVETNLPEDDRTVRDLHQAEVVEATRAPAQPRLAVAAPKPEPRPEPEPAPHAEAKPAPSLTARISAATLAQVEAALVAPPAPTPIKPVPIAVAPATPALATLQPTPQPAPAASAEPIRIRPVVDTSRPRLRLSPGDDIVDAPSIGPRMAERLHPQGILKVSDLLAAEPEAIAKGLDQSGITAKTVGDWQAQARLVCEVPGLTGTGAQLFVAAGYRSIADVATAEPEKLCADVLAVAAMPGGQRILRDGPPPDIARIKAWTENARQAKAA